MIYPATIFLLLIAIVLPFTPDDLTTTIAIICAVGALGAYLIERAQEQGAIAQNRRFP